MTPGKWKVFSNPICGEKFYRVGRIIDTDKPVHSGNIEYAGDYNRDKEACEKIAAVLNAKEAHDA